MSAAIEAFPLTWPVGRPRTRSRRDADFAVPLGQARDELVRSLRLLGARGVVISSNMRLRRDGLPYADQREPDDAGVAVYFDRRPNASTSPGVWVPFVVACDSYRKVRHNLRAIGLTIEALRSIQRYGASEMLEQAFTGFAALPPPRTVDAPWWETLGVSQNADAAAVRDAYRELARIHHPDAGGETETMARINRTYETWKSWRARGST